MSIYIWHDDVRPAPEGWHRARNNDEAMALLREHEVGCISLDHDLGGDEAQGIFVQGNAEITGMHLVDDMIAEDLVPPRVIIHSWNIVRAAEMSKRLRDAGHRPIIQPFDPDRGY